MDDVKLPNDVVHTVGPDIVVPMLMSPGKPGLSRSFDIALAVYELAVQQGWFQGEIV